MTDKFDLLHEDIKTLRKEHSKTQEHVVSILQRVTKLEVKSAIYGSLAATVISLAFKYFGG